MRTLGCVLVLGALALAGCGTSDDRRQARAAVERFYAAITTDRGGAACAELSGPARQALESQSAQPCRDAITRLDYEPGAIVATEVFITNARVRLDSGESAFLSREARAWKLSAIACRPARGTPRDRPFDCEVEA